MGARVGEGARGGVGELEGGAAQGNPWYAGNATQIYLEKAFRDASLGSTERLPVARELGETSPCFLCHAWGSWTSAWDGPSRW